MNNNDIKIAYNMFGNKIIKTRTGTVILSPEQQREDMRATYSYAQKKTAGVY